MGKRTFYSFAGSVYELGFKLGFATEAERRSERELKDQWKEIKERLLLKTEEKHFGEFAKVLKKIEGETLCQTKILKERERSILEIVREAGIGVDNNSKLLRLITLFVIGMYEGIFFVRHYLPEGEISPWVFDFGSESPNAGIYQNADLIFRIKGKEIHVYDLKLYGGAYHIIRMLTPYQEKELGIIPPSTRGMQLSITLGERSLEKFASNIYEIGEELLNKEEIGITPEIKNIIQLLSYSLDLLSKERKYISEKEIVMGLIYSTTDAPVFRFPIEDGKDYTDLAKKIRELYEKIKEQVDGGDVLKIGAELSSGWTLKGKIRRLENVMEKIRKEKEKLWEEIKERENREVVIVPEERVSKLREKVYNEVKKFYESGPWGRGLALLHSTGAGKTRSVIEIFLKQMSEKVIFLYFAPRIQLLKEVKESVEKNLQGIKTVWPYTKEDEEREELETLFTEFTKKGDLGEQRDTQEGKLKSAIDEAHSLVADNHEKIAVFLTTQAVTRTPKTKETTFRHLKGKLLNWILKGYKIVIALDEITGARNGFLAFEEALKLLKGEQETNEKTIKFSESITLLIFDASLHSKKVFEKIIREWEDLGFISPAFIFSELEREGVLEVKGIPIEVRTGFSYPAKKLKIREKFLLEKGRKELLEKVAEICIEEAKKQKEKGERLFIYIQDRNAVMEIKNKLQAEGLKVYAITLNSRQSLQSLEDKDFSYDVVVSTSSLSRGVSLKHRFTKSIIITSHFFHPEEGAMEDLQAGARMRGMENDEEVEKEILRVYAVYTEDENAMQEISNKKKLILDDRVNTFLEVFLEEELQEEEYEAIESKLKELLKEKLVRDYLKEMLVYGNLILKLYESYYNPKERIVSVIAAQSRPVYYPESLSTAGKLFSFLKELHNYGDLSEEEKNLVRKFLEELRQQAFTVSPRIIINGKRTKIIGYYPPYLIVENELRFSPNYDPISELLSIYTKIKPKIKRENSDILQEFEKLFKELSTGRKIYKILSLVYVPALAIGYECIDKNFQSICLYFPKSITRHQVEVLGASLGLYAQIRINPSSKELEGVVFPISALEADEWIKSPYPRIDGELLFSIIHKLTHQGPSN